MHHPLPLAVRTAAFLLASSTMLCAQWVQRTPAAAPSARVGAAMTFDPFSGGVVLFGGSAASLSAETWVYDGSNWTLLAPATSPTARFGAQLVYDLARGVSVLYGGLASPISIPPPNNDTWEWNGTTMTWTQATPTANAGNRYWYGACYDSVRGRTVMYGGATTQLISVPNAQTWEYDGTTWSQITTVGNPGPRSRPAMCFHAGIGKAVLFGGDNGSGVTNSTWLYDGTTWTQVPAIGAVPPARSSASMAYDSTRGLCVLTGGQDASGVLADTWTFDGATWKQQPFATQGVRDHTLAELPTTKQIVKFGGFVTGPFVLSNQTWEFGSGIFGKGCPGVSGTPAMVAVQAPQLGQSYTLNISNLDPAVNFAVLALGLTRLPGIDLTFVLDMPGCAAFTTPDILVNVPGAAGAGSWTWPTVTGLVGDAIYAQALCVDSGLTGFPFTISNAVYATLLN